MVSVPELGIGLNSVGFRERLSLSVRLGLILSVWPEVVRGNYSEGIIYGGGSESEINCWESFLRVQRMGFNSKSCGVQIENNSEVQRGNYSECEALKRFNSECLLLKGIQL